MIKRIASGLLTLLLATVLATPEFAQQQAQTSQDKHSQEIRKYIKSLRRWDVGDPVTVKLYDGTKIKGHVTETTEDHFMVTDRNSGQSTPIDYAKVSEVSEGMGRKTKFALVIAGAILAYVGICAATHSCQN